MARFDLRCPRCELVTEIQAPIGKTPIERCSNCDVLMQPYFGRMKGQDISINYGFRPQNYSNETDERIARYQFTHLMKD